ncbi:hypothetical protein LIER_12509 [Lithospermum erythrorhizon]|uniref:VQ domain-containing protein n=1 Tax=Lithospermum erythrorhizon TaxID=34254 RepID=A0AAV3PRZ9_LITER
MNIATIDNYQEQPQNTIFNHYNHSTSQGHGITLKGNLVKPVSRIRRTRSSRKTPTTLLNANVNNFRTLVQQYTGFQSVNNSLHKIRKGPINLNFAIGNEVKEEVNTISISSNSTTEGFGYNNWSKNGDYYQETSQVEDHRTFVHSSNSLNSIVSEASVPDDML